jgi:hypothetical protein
MTRFGCKKIQAGPKNKGQYVMNKAVVLIHFLTIAN